VPAAIGAAAFVISWLALLTLSTQGFRRRIREVGVAFPPPAP
jgi:hypothetical protein